MNENKRMLIFFVSIVLVVAIILVIAFWPEADTTFTCSVKADKEYSKLGSVNYSQYECLQEEEKYALVISDGLSDAEKAAINEAAESLNVGIYYLSDDLSNSDLNSIKSDLETDDTSYDDTTLVIVEDGEVVSFMDEDLDSAEDVYDFLEEAGLTLFACGATSDSEYENLSKLTYDQYDCLYNSDDPFVVIITQSTCSYCEQFLPIMNEYAGENNLPVYFLEIDTMDSDDLQSVLSSLTYFDDNDSWGTPLTLAIQDQEVVTELSGYTSDTSSIDSIFTEIGLKE